MFTLKGYIRVLANDFIYSLIYRMSYNIMNFYKYQRFSFNF